MSSDERFLAAAESICTRVVREAVWHAGRCSWVGATENTEAPWRSEYRALGRDLYRGTAGVGLALAQFAATTGDGAARRTAVGALRHAAAGEPYRRDGLHAGAAGIAWATARAAVLLDEEELLGAARSALAGVPAPDAPRRRADITSGGAGVIVGLLALAGPLADPSLVEHAAVDGERLIAASRADRHGCSWPLLGTRGPQRLCGLAHGASGIGWALAELFAATGDERFRDCALGACAFERSWLDMRTGTWPDLRIPGQRRGAWRLPAPTTGTWCHGEAGIALARLRMATLVGQDTDLHQDAANALETCRRRVARALPYPIEDLSLCHGLGGTADVLLTAGLVQIALRLGQVAVERNAGDGEWPCSTPGWAPGLFLGETGIASLLLRLHEPKAPSLLEISSDD
jgi:lantibiotic modifying enzyme